MSKKTCGIIAIIADLLITLIEVFVIAKVIPYTVIGGGRLSSYEKAVPLAGFSIVVQVILAFAIAISSGIIEHVRCKKVTDWVLRIFTIYFSINIIMNLMGKTWFEKLVGSTVCVIQIICFIRILRKSNR
ncbi:hypothetical protein [Anaerosporobacter faecicola]|uniref:hypothetical protein n=1 Tax=Anaerosporobacter faecicola TaxID=2718714 RepID=UPI00143A5F81|nr:hypothetical protein [Anaerosporobacter faecicola]